MSSNVNNTIKNSSVSVIAQIITMLTNFIGRRIFVYFLDIEYLGYLSIFSNIFTILSFSELGIGGIITYYLYKEVANDNKEEIGKLMNVYKLVYQITAFIIALLGIFICIFLPTIVSDTSIGWNKLRLLFIMQLISVVIGYLLVYRRTIYTVHQKMGYLAIIDLTCTIIAFVAKFTVLAITRNFFLYYLVSITFSMMSNLIIYAMSEKHYPYLKQKYAFSREYLKSRKIVQDVSNFLVHRIAGLVFAGTDNIVISTFCGIRQVALYSNYFVLQSGVMQLFFYQLLNPLQAAIGNVVYRDEDRATQWKQYQAFNIFSLYFATYLCLGFLLFFQPVITLWLGKEYLLDYSFVVVYSIYIYFGAVFEITWKYRTTFGEYEKDRFFMIASAISNITLSVLLAPYYGVTGVQFGTLVGSMCIFAGRIKMVVGNLFGKSVRRYWVTQIIYFFIIAINCTLIIQVVDWFDLMNKSIIVQLLFRMSLWITFPFIVCTAITFRSPSFPDFKTYLKRIKYCS